MKKITILMVALILIMVSTASISYADTISVGNNEIVYDSQEDLEAIYAAIIERMANDYNTILFDADTYDSTSYIIGETFPAGRYYVYPVVVSETNTDLFAKLLWWDKDAIDEYFCTDYVCAEWCYTVTLTEGMKIEFSWDEDQRGVSIAMQQLPDTPESLMDIFD